MAKSGVELFWEVLDYLDTPESADRTDHPCSDNSSRQADAAIRTQPGLFDSLSVQDTPEHTP